MYCSNCGTRVEDHIQYCGNCGKQIQEDTEQIKKSNENSSFDNRSSSQKVKTKAYLGPLPKQRSWGLWFIGSILLFGIPYFVYNVLIIQDMNKLDRSSTHDRQKMSYRSTENDFGLMILFLIFLPPVFFYMKYNSLHKHLSEQHGKENSPMSGDRYLVIFLTTIVLSWTLIVPVITSFYFIYQENKWQVHMNHHIRDHNLT